MSASTPASSRKRARGFCGTKSVWDKGGTTRARICASIRMSPTSSRSCSAINTLIRRPTRRSRRPRTRQALPPSPPKPKARRPKRSLAGKRLSSSRLQGSGAPATPDAESLESFLRHLRVDRNVSPRTLVNYRLDIRKFLAYLADIKRDIFTVERDDITEYLWRQKSKGAHPSSIARYVASRRSFYRYLATEERLGKNPTTF